MLWGDCEESIHSVFSVDASGTRRKVIPLLISVQTYGKIWSKAHGTHILMVD